MEIKAARLAQHATPLSVESLELGAAGSGEVVVDMAYAGVNPVDRYIAQGLVAPDGPLPRTLGGEGAGTVDGRPVVVRGHGIGTQRDGLWATQAVVPRASLIAVPEGTDLRQAAAVSVAGVTAWRLVAELANVHKDDRVVVLGAGGGVGSAAVSIAKARGATVWGQTSDHNKADWIAGLGCDRVVVAGADRLAEELSALQPTVAIDVLGDGFTGACVTALIHRGRIALAGTSAGPTGEIPLQPLYRKSLTIHGYGGLMESDEALAAAVEVALDALLRDELYIAIDTVVPLRDVNDALTRLERRQVCGKLVIDCSAG
jgi:NADPH2:quinone reductase